MTRQPLKQGVRHEVLARDGFRCRYCGASAEEAKLHVDHIRPVSRGGDNDPGNLLTACSACNLGKGRRYTWSACSTGSANECPGDAGDDCCATSEPGDALLAQWLEAAQAMWAHLPEKKRRLCIGYTLRDALRVHMMTRD